MTFIQFLNVASIMCIAMYFVIPFLFTPPDMETRRGMAIALARILCLLVGSVLLIVASLLKWGSA